MNTIQQKVIATIESCITHDHIDSAIQYLDNYIETQRHEQLFFDKCVNLITQKILTVSFQNPITVN